MSRQDRFSWFASQQSRCLRGCKSPPASVSFLVRRLHVEELEDRRLLAVFTVSNLNDTGTGSLREAITLAEANGGADMINFSVTGTIAIGSQLPTITEGLTITGPGAQLLTIDAGDGGDNTFDTQDGFRIFHIDDGTLSQIAVTLSGLTLSGGDVASGDLYGYGGAILNRENLTLTGSVVSGSAASSIGGGIFNSGTANVTGSTLTGNSASYNGGGIYNSGTANVTGSTISGNAAGGSGGGIDNYYGLTAIDHSTISGNTAYYSGGGISNSGTANVTSSTITGNSAGGSGGGFYNYYGTATLNNTMVSGNDVGYSPDNLYLYGGSFSGNFNLLGTGATTGGANDLISDAPLLGPLADNGGPTETHALLAGSPAINAGSSIETNDQRGAPFVRNDGGGVDIGAYERQTLAASYFVVTTTTDELDYSNGDVSLREAINSANGSVGADTITFAAALDGDTINLLQALGELDVAADATIDAGSLAGGITVYAGNGTDNLFNTGDGFRIFHIDDGTLSQIAVTLSGLTLSGGDVASGDLYGYGGAILNRENLTLTGSVVSGSAASSIGGGIFNSGTANVTGSTLTGNSASYNGGGIYNSGTANVTGSTISGNAAAYYGGGISNSGTTNITSSTISGNSAGGSGGGIDSYYGLTAIEHSTISGNSAGGSGGGFYNYYGTATLNNTMVSGNDVGGSPDNLDGSFSGNFNLLGTGAATYGANDLFSDTPLLAPLADNGGPTQTHALLVGSPAIDAGDTGFSPPPNYDQRGFAFSRVVGGRIDIGAVERGAESADFDQDGVVSGFDFLRWQLGAGTTGAAVHSDGDANIDGNVGGADLDVWELQHGTAAPLVAAATAPTSAASFSTERIPSNSLSSKAIAPIAVPSLASSDLVDVALAVELASDVTRQERPPPDDQPISMDTPTDTALATGDIAPAGPVTFEVDVSSTSSPEVKEAEDQWLSDELLERVFG